MSLQPSKWSQYHVVKITAFQYMYMYTKHYTTVQYINTRPEVPKGGGGGRFMCTTQRPLRTISPRGPPICNFSTHLIPCSVASSAPGRRGLGFHAFKQLDRLRFSARSQDGVEIFRWRNTTQNFCFLFRNICQ